MVRFTNRLDMTIAVDWDVKPQKRKTGIANEQHKLSLQNVNL